VKSHLQILLRSSATLLALCFILSATAVAQIATADLAGRVLDQNGAAVPGATVTIRHTGTGISRTTTSNDDGDYFVTQIPAGTYEITVEKQGFTRAIVRSLELNVGTRSTLNVDLQPGQITESVEVSAGSLLVETTKSDLADVVTPIQVQTLPLLNRTFANLAFIAPEARPTGNFDPTKTRVGNVAFNGGDGRQVDVNVDGGDNKDNVVGSLIQNFAYEGIQEFQVLQHRWTAEAGRSVGGIVNVVTKSGTNEFHGSLFANFRHQSLRAQDFFEKQLAAADPSFEKPPFNRQEIGGSFGGPIKRDRLFFFGTYERFRERQNNVITAAALPQLQAIPGIALTGDTIATPYDDHLLTAKIDHKINDDQHIFYRFSHQQNTSPNDQIPVPATADLTFGNTTANNVDSFVVNHAWTVSPTKLNQWVFHYQDFKNEILGVTDRPGLTFPSVQTGRNPNTPQATLEKKFQLRDDFSLTAGDHNLKIGGNYIYTRLDGFFFFGAQGYVYTFFDDPLVIANNTNGRYPQGFNTPGAVRQITFSDGEASHKQTINQVAFYVQDDWKFTPRLTFNLGLRWDANIGNLINQDNNRTITILRQLNHPLAQAITRDRDKLTRTTPSWTEFQPRVGFAFDPTGAGRTVIRGGYGIFYDQLFQNLTLFSLSQTGRELFQTVLSLTNTSVGVGQLAGFRFLTDPPPPLPADFSISELSVGGFGRINDPDASEPYVQKFSLGFETSIGRNMTLSSDYVHTLGVNEPRVQVINPRIGNVCNPAFPGSNPASPLCVRGVNSRLLDRAFVDAGFPSNRIEQINMIGTTNRSLFDSWATTLRYRSRRIQSFSASYVLSSSRSWGGQPLASYSGNGIATTPDNQFKEEEFGPTRLDERHRIVVTGVFDLPGNFQLAPLFQFASARPYSLNAGIDIDGDGLVTNDRVCEGVTRDAIFAARGNSAAIAALNPLGCRQVRVNSEREGFITDADGNITDERSGRYLNMDLRVQKTFRIGERVGLKGFVDFFNLFNTENLSFSNRLGNTPATASGTFMQPNSLYGPGFGPPVGRPFTMQVGVRMDF
jgi:hypothetical protein